MDPEAFQTDAFQNDAFQVLLGVIATFTMRIIGGPVMRAAMTARGVLVATWNGGPTFTGPMSGGPV